MTLAPIRPFQEPETPQVPGPVGRAWMRVPEIASDPGTKDWGADEWNRFTTYQAERGQIPPLNRAEQTEFAAGNAKHALKGIRLGQERAIADYWLGDHLGDVEADPLVKAAARAHLGKEMGAKHPGGLDWDTFLRGDEVAGMTDAQRDRVEKHIEDWRGPLGEYYRNHPMAVASKRKAKETENTVARIYKDHGLDGLRDTISFIRDADPQMADNLSDFLVLMEKQKSSEILGVGAEEGVNPYAVTLGLSAYPAPAGSKEAQVAVGFANRYAKGSGYQEMVPVIVDEREVRLPFEEAISLPDAHKNAGVTRAITKWANSEEGKSHVEGMMTEKQRAVAIHVAAHGRDKLAAATMGLAKGLEREAPEMVDDELGDSVYDFIMDMTLRPVGGGAMWAVDKGLSLLGAGSKSMASVAQAAHDYGVRAFVFQDGSVETDAIKAAEKRLALLAAGGVDEQVPNLAGAVVDRRHRAHLMSLKQWQAEKYKLGGGAKKGVIYARPTQIIDVTEEGSWGEVWSDMTRVMDDDSPWLYDVIKQSESVGYVGERGKGFAFGVDFVVDPWNIASFGSTVAARNVARSSIRIADLSSKAGRHHKSVADFLDATKAVSRTGKSRRRFGDGMLMSEEFAGAADLISARLGGGMQAEAYADWWLTAVKEDPSIVKRGAKDLFVKRPEHVMNTLLRAGDGRINSASKQMLEEAKATGRVANPVQEFSVLRDSRIAATAQFMDEVVDDVDAITRAIPKAAPTYGWFGGGRKIADMHDFVNAGQHQGKRGVSLANTFKVSPTPLFQKIAPKGKQFADDMAKMIPGVEGTLSKAKALADKVRPRMFWVGGGPSMNFWNLQGKAESTRIPLAVKRIMQMEYQRSMTHFSETAVPYMAGLLAESIPGKIGLAERTALFHMLDVPGGIEDKTKHLLEYRDDIKALKGLTDYEVAEMVERLSPAEGEMRKLVDDIFAMEMGKGLHKTAEPSYITHIPISGKKFSEPASHKLEAHAPDAMAKSEGEATSMVQKERDGFLVTAADKIRHGHAIEQDIFEVMLYRMSEHQRLMSAANLIESVSLAVGTPAVRGRHAAMMAFEADADGKAAFLGRVPTSATEAQRFLEYEANISAAMRDAKGAGNNFLALKDMLGMSTGGVMAGGFSGKLLEHKSLLKAARSKTGGRVLSKVFPESMQPHVRNLAKMAHEIDKREGALRRRAARLGVKWGSHEGKVSERMSALLEAIGVDDTARAVEIPVKEELGIISTLMDLEKAELRGVEADIKKLTRMIEVKEAAADRHLKGMNARVLKSSGEKTSRELVQRKLKAEIDRITELRAGAKQAKQMRKDLGANAVKLKEEIALRKTEIARLSDISQEARKGASAARRKIATSDASGKAIARERARLAAEAREIQRLSEAAGVVGSKLSKTPLLASMEGAIVNYARLAGQAQMRVKSLIGEASERFGIENLSRKEMLRREASKWRGIKTEKVQAAAATRKGNLPGSEIVNPEFAHMRPQDANAYENLALELKEYGIEGDVLASVLWDYYRVTGLSQLPFEDAVAMTEKMVPVRDFFANPLAGEARRKVRMTTDDKRVQQIGKRLGVENVPGESGSVYVYRLGQHIEQLKAAAKAEDPEAVAALGRITKSQERAILNAEKAHLPTASAIPEAHEELILKADTPLDEIHNTLVRAMGDGSSPIANIMKDVYVPLDVGVAIRSMLNEKIHVGARDVGALVTVSTLSKFGDALARFFKMNVLTGVLGTSFGWRNRLDGLKAQLQMQNLKWFFPHYHQEVKGILDGTATHIDTPRGPIPVDRIIKAHDQFDSSMAARVDSPRLIQADAAHDKAREQSFKAGIEDFEGMTRGRQMKSLEGKRAKIRAGNIKGAVSGMSLGALGGYALGGGVGAAIVGFGGYSMGHALQTTGLKGVFAGRPRGMVGAGGRARPTRMEKVLPVHSVAPEVMEKYDKVWYHYHMLKTGASETEAIEQTLTLFRDYSNYKPAERGFMSWVMVAFYNFAKQNTIAQVHRMAEKPGWGPMWVKFLAYLNDETPEEMRPEWLSPLNSFVRGQRTFYLADEFAAPAEWASTLLSDEADRLLLPTGRALVSALKQDFRPVRLPNSLARSLAEKYGPTDTESPIHISVDKSGRATADLGLIGTIAAVVTGADIALRKGAGVMQSLQEGSMERAMLQFMLGVKSYEVDTLTEKAFSIDGAADQSREMFAENVKGMVLDERGVFSRYMLGEALSVVDQAKLRLIMKELSGDDFDTMISEFRRGLKFALRGSEQTGVAPLPQGEEE